MFTFLLVIIYVAFIGLGLPHSLFGAAWPAIQIDFGVSLDAANYVTVMISGCTVISSIFGSRLTKKLGTARIVTAGTILAAFALLGFSFAPNIAVMCLCAIPLGLAAGATDFSLNNYIALNYSAMHMNFLHCFYGVGVMTSPYLMSIILDASSWQSGYRVIFAIQAAIALIMIFSLPLWKKAGGKECEISDGAATVPVSYLKMAKQKSVRLDWLMCIAANAIEGVGGLWGSTYLVHAHGLTEAGAAGAITLFYIGMAGGRFLSGILSHKLSGDSLIKTGTLIMGVGVGLMLIPVPTVAIIGLFFLGLGNGPVHPNIMHLTPRRFGEKYSASLVGSQMASAYFGIMLAPPIFGLIASSAGAEFFPLYIAAWLFAFIVSAVLFGRVIRGFDPDVAFSDNKET